MALAAALLSEDQFTCSICLEIFNNPVSTPCGHSFCQVCISSYWDRGRGGGGGGGEGGGAKIYQCPLCKESFRKRPELQINRSLKEITERFKIIANTEIPINVRGGVEDPNSHPGHHHHPALPLPQRPGEMPECVFAEMMTRFHQLTPGEPNTTLPLPSNPQPQSPNPVDAHLSLQTQNNEYQDPPPPYSPPCRYTVSGTPSDTSLGLPLCPIHLRGLEFFCRTDNTCVCSVCLEKAEHRGHNVIPAKREWNIKKANNSYWFEWVPSFHQVSSFSRLLVVISFRYHQVKPKKTCGFCCLQSQLNISEVELKDLICEKKRKVEEIQNSLREIQAAAERETEGAVCVFSKLISSVERCQTEVLEVIEMTQRAAEHRAQSLLRELEEEISVLNRRSTALSQLALSEDYIHFLRTFPALSTPPQTKDWSGVSVVSELTSGVILKTVSHMMERFQEDMLTLPVVCQQSLLDQSVPRPNPKIRRVQEYAVDITLDPSTAHPRLIISADGKQVHCGDRHQLVPDNPERFDRVVCVLAHQGLSSGRHYWEVKVGGKTDWDLGVASWSVNRKGKITVSPAHGYWFLSLRDRTDYAFRTEPSTSLTVNLRPSRIGIYVDYDKGLVSFYNMEARVLIHTFTDTFSGTIYPFFSPCTNKSGRNEAPLIICPVAMT
ncbi:E3 ubiquitin-protein ligase TRIM7-like isoform X2 [Acanthopagrus latus]|uniref:E3 ubiquitin-protein ligase TRIM7-like isoform X2 n=1 Tax=Acanthopagrus latus TaxID=8177 RepID=UPI00187C0F6C|nr:E3 ubiquitin-protein ligase TRIM7-like isoform X2 [Acanthopagrus latus]